MSVGAVIAPRNKMFINGYKNKNKKIKLLNGAKFNIENYMKYSEPIIKKPKKKTVEKFHWQPNQTRPPKRRPNPQMLTQPSNADPTPKKAAKRKRIEIVKPQTQKNHAKVRRLVYL